MKHLWLPALFFAGLTAAAGAGELRPLEDSTVCLDSATELRPGFRKIVLAPCNREQTQNARRGDQNTISIGSLCLQAISMGPRSAPGAPPAPLVYDVLATPCTGGPGQRWAMASDGRITSGEKLCLGVESKDGVRGVTMVECKEKTEDRAGQRWAIYGKF
jgi:hypothetical protein